MHERFEKRIEEGLEKDRGQLPEAQAMAGRGGQRVGRLRWPQNTRAGRGAFAVQIDPDCPGFCEVPLAESGSLAGVGTAQ